MYEVMQIDGVDWVEYATEGMRRKAPKTFATVCPRRIALPEGEAENFIDPKMAQAMDLELAMGGAFGMGNLPGSSGIAWALVAMRAAYGMPVFMMNELMVEALLLTDLPEAMDARELKWPFPALRLLLPLKLFSWDSEHGRRSVGLVDVGFSIKGESVRMPKAAEAELRKIVGGGTQMTWAFDGILLSTGVTPSPGGTFDVLSKHYPWEEAFRNDVVWSVPIERGDALTDAEREVMRKLTVVAVNTLMITASHPELITPEVVLQRADPNRSLKTRKALYTPGMIGFPKWPEEPQGHSERHTDIKHAPHWARGHWRRQHYGPGGSQVRPKWIMPYRTGQERRTELEAI